MTVNDRNRLALHRTLETVLGTEEADTLMDLLPPVTWHDVVTNQHVQSSEAATRSELARTAGARRAEVQSGSAAVDAKFARIEAHFTTVRGDMHGGFAEVRGDVHRAINEQTRWIFGFMCVWSAATITVWRLLQ